MANNTLVISVQQPSLEISVQQPSLQISVPAPNLTLSAVSVGGTGTVTSVSIASPLSNALLVTNPSTSPVISIQNASSPATQALLGNGTWGNVVTRLIAGTGISLNPAGGVGAVTVSSSGGGATRLVDLTDVSITEPTLVDSTLAISSFTATVITTTTPIGTNVAIGDYVRGTNVLGNPTLTRVSSISGNTITVDTTIGLGFSNGGGIFKANSTTLNGQVVTYDLAVNKWTAKTPAPGGVTQLVAGSNITLSPPSGTGVVTINSSGGSGGGGTSWTSPTNISVGDIVFGLNASVSPAINPGSTVVTNNNALIELDTIEVINTVVINLTGYPPNGYSQGLVAGIANRNLYACFILNGSALTTTTPFFISRDGGFSWRIQGYPSVAIPAVGTNLFLFNSGTNWRAIYVSSAISTFTSSNDGVTWGASSDIVSGTFQFIDAVGNNIYFLATVSGINRIYYSTNFGATWNFQLIVGNFLKTSGTSVMVITRNSSSTTGQISTDSGTTFNAFTLPATNIRVMGASGSTWLLATATTVYRSVDNGATWTSTVLSPTPSFVLNVTKLEKYDTAWYLQIESSIVYISIDDGLTFTGAINEFILQNSTIPFASDGVTLLFGIPSEVGQFGNLNSRILLSFLKNSIYTTDSESTSLSICSAGTYRFLGGVPQLEEGGLWVRTA